MDRIERKYGERLNVVRLNIQDPSGKAAAERYGAPFTPTFILLDVRGEEIWRSVGLLDLEELEARLA